MSAVFVSIYEFFYTAINLIGAAFSNFRVADVLDIVIVWFVLYKIIALFRDTRSKPLVKGIFILLLVWALAKIFNLVVLNWAFAKAVDYVIIAALLIFQPELRHALERVGYSKLNLFGRLSTVGTDRAETLEQICTAADRMHRDKVGALIVLERETRLNEMASRGTILDASVSSELLCNLFYPKSPLHDGAVLVREGRVFAAACLLPLSDSPLVAKELGTRHRAAIGLTECTDSVVVIVSEETGTISIAMDGNITRGYTKESLQEKLKEIFLGQTDVREGAFSRLRSRLTKKDESEDSSHE